MARSGWIKHKEGPAGFQSPVDVLQNLRWVSEVVDHVERCDELIVIPLFKPCCVLGLEANVIQSPKLCFCPGGGDGIVGEIVAPETAVREGLGHEVEHNYMPAPDSRGWDARRSPGCSGPGPQAAGPLPRDGSGRTDRTSRRVACGRCHVSDAAGSRWRQRPPSRQGSRIRLVRPAPPPRRALARIPEGPVRSESECAPSRTASRA